MSCWRARRDRRRGTDVPPGLGKRLRLLRLLRELSQDELGQAAGVSRSLVSLIEKGAHGVDVVRLWRLAGVRDLPLHELVNLDLPAT